ncbi:MAG TPA: nitrite reductase large subunit NirB [Polyangiaceae bacterium]|nr:nitrite reductase large subunit NirB [Polyangiaceae bacterium]
MADAGLFSNWHVALPNVSDLDASARLIRQEGAELTRFDVTPVESGSRPLEGWIMELTRGEFDDVVFFTAQGVRLIVEFARQLDREEEVASALRSARKIAQGPKPAAALRESGFRADAAAPLSSFESLSGVLATLDLQGRVVGIASLRPDPRLLDLLEKKGATVRLLSNSPGSDAGALALYETVRSGTLRAIVMSSPAQAEALWEVACVHGTTHELRSELAKVRLVALGSAVELALRQHGIRVDDVPPRSTFVRPQASELGRVFGVGETPVVNGAPAVESDGPARITAAGAKQKLVIIGNGMVGWKLCERIAELDTAGRYQVVAFCEEPRPAYDRVGLTSFFEKASADEMLLAGLDWYRQRGVRLLLGERATVIDRRRKVITSSSGERVPYDVAVMCTGSTAFVPPIPGVDKAGVFVYRTIEDLIGIRDYAKRSKRAVVLGGGLLGLEAAKAVHEMGLQTHVVEFAPRLMPRQLDGAGSRLLLRSIRALGVEVHLNVAAQRVLGGDRVEGVEFSEGDPIETDMLIVAAGIRPRDELAREAGIIVGDRGGVVIDDQLRTSDASVRAIGECAIHNNQLYGLVAPGYEMASVLARILTGDPSARFEGADLSAKLKLLGVDVASFGDPFADTTGGASILYEDLVKGVYKKLVISEDRTRLLGGILVGDATEYGKLTQVMRSGSQLPDAPEELIFGQRAGESAAAGLGDSAQVCSCNNVTKRDICHAIRRGECSTVGEIKAKTKAGTGCGGCMPLVTDILKAEQRAAGQVVREQLCEHFAFSRQELFQVVKVKGFRTFSELIASHGEGNGCEICKPAVASILASLHNDMILAGEHASLQDTNDRYLANMQRGGLYSIVPRIPGGEIVPEKLIVLGQIAKKYGLYTKITGGQRIDLFGARLEQLPEIWEELVAAGFESGHAYGKALRTVKSCVGTTWCRFGVQDSVKFAIEVENRYKGLRAPHKLKSAVSGCVRECAEAQGKDFGIIATEKGWNLYVCGNGGMKPKHAVLLASDLDKETCIRYIDRFLMYYITTADRLTRTSTWLEKLDGGIDYLREVVIEDRLGICADLEQQMQYLVQTYKCEWAEVVKDPQKRAKFRHFANTPEADDSIEMMAERGQARPRDWVKDRPESVRDRKHLPLIQTSWIRVGRVEDFPLDGGMAVRHGNAQIAVYNFSSRGEWYATQNMCPHMRDMVLARGLLGDQKGTPKVACPQHKKTFSLKSGECLSGDPLRIRTFPVRVEGGYVLVELPSARDVDKLVPVKLTEIACQPGAE